MNEGKRVSRSDKTAAGLNSRGKKAMTVVSSDEGGDDDDDGGESRGIGAVKKAKVEELYVRHVVGERRCAKMR